MQGEDLEAKLYKLLASCVPERNSNKQILPDMVLRRDLGLDSVQLLFLVFKFEQEFGVELPGNALAKGAMTSVGELIERGKEVLQQR